MEPLGPYSLASVTEVEVTWPTTGQTPIGVDLQNISGNLLQAQYGGQNLWILPWTARYIPVAASSSKMAVIVETDITPVAGDPLTLSAQLYQQGDRPPAIGERQLAGMASSIQGVISEEQVKLGTFTYTATVPGGSFTVEVPSSVNAIGFFFDITNSPAGLFLTVTGGDSIYGPILMQTWPFANYGIVAGQNNRPYKIVPFEQMKSQILIQYGLTDSSGSETFTVDIVGYTGSIPPASAPDAVALFFGGTNNFSGGPFVADTHGRKYRIHSLSVTNGTGGNFLGIAVNSVSGPMPLSQPGTVSFNPPLVVNQLYPVYDGSPAGLVYSGVSYSYHE